MESSEIQKQLFQQIKTRTGDQAILLKEIAGLLEISEDSVYRRMRGEKQITLDELHKLCNHYRVSLDQLMGLRTGAFLFEGRFLDSKTHRFDAYLTGALQAMGYMNSF